MPSILKGLPMARKRSAIFPWLIALLSLAPLLLYAYLGQFSRIIADDYCVIAQGQTRGAWDYMIHTGKTWSGGYSFALFAEMTEPLGIHSARIAPTILIVLWLVGLRWLIVQRLAGLKIDHSRRALSVTMAALTVAAVINAFYSPQSLYWEIVVIRYTLPLALLTVYMALALWTARRPGNIPTSLGIIAGGGLCFISAGFSEMYVVFQSTFLTLCLLMALTLAPGNVRRSYAFAFGVGWLATLCSLTIQLISPGVARRAASYADETMYRSLSALVSETMQRLLDYIDSPPVVLGFVMLMAVGLLVMLVKYKPPPALSVSKPAALSRLSLWFGLMFQLLWLSWLWGREGGGAMAVILNFAAVLSFAVLLWQRQRINARLRKHDRRRLIVYNAMTLVFVCAALFATARQNLFHHTTSHYLYTSLLVLGGMIIWQLSSLLSTAAARRFGLLALFSYAAAVVCAAAVAAVSLYGIGFVPLRLLPSSAFLLAASGLIWGAYIGYALKHCGHYGQAWIKFVKPASAVIALTIGIGIALGQIRLIPDFQLYAREWDARHQAIIAMRNSGQKDIEVSPLTFDLTEYVGLGSTLSQFPTNGCARDYYGVDSIVVRDT